MSTAVHISSVRYTANIHNVHIEWKKEGILPNCIYKWNYNNVNKKSLII